MKTCIIISACLTGENCKYNGEHNLITEPSSKKIMDGWETRGMLIPVCPEVLAGLPIPRPPAEIRDLDGFAVLETKRGVFNQDGQDLSKFLISGAIRTLNLVNKYGARVAVFKDKSPSCGVSQIYNGSFRGELKQGCGVTSALLIQNGVKLFNEEELVLAAKFVGEQSL
jgi:uncharacterized protein YbbK (DUF523 family)